MNEQPPPPDAPGGPRAAPAPHLGKPVFAPPPSADADELPPSYRDSVAARPRRAHSRAGLQRANTSTSHGTHSEAWQRQRQTGSLNNPTFCHATSATPIVPSPDAAEQLLVEERPLPIGWIRQFSPDHSRWYYVDTDENKGTGRSTWNHPLFDEIYLSTLDPDERTLVEWDNKLFMLRQMGVSIALCCEPQRVLDARDALAQMGDTDEIDRTSEPPDDAKKRRTSAFSSGILSAGQSPDPSSAAPSAPGGTQTKRVRRFKRMGRRLKDGVTKSTHAERAEKRKAKKKRQDTFSDAQARLCKAFATSRDTGVPQFVQEDLDGRDVLVLPPRFGPVGPPGADQPMPLEDPYAFLLKNPRLKCVRTPNFEAALLPNGGNEVKQQGAALPIVTGVVGGLILGALLV